MRNLMIALMLLLLAVTTTDQAAPPDPAQNDAASRFYDVTELVEWGLSEPRTRLRLGSGITNLGDGPAIVYPDEPVFHTDAPIAEAGDGIERLEEIISECAGPFVNKGEDFDFAPAIIHSRVLVYVVAPPAAHTRIKEVLDLMHAAVRARVRLTVLEDGRVLGTASGAIGEQMSVAVIANAPIMSDSQRLTDHRDEVFVEDVHTGREVNCWAVKLSDGRLRVHGQITEREFTRARPVMTSAGPLQMPEIASRFHPFVADVTDPGVTKMTANGRQYELRLSCGADFPNTQRKLSNGIDYAEFNLMGTLRRHLTGGDPFDCWVWYDFADPYEWDNWGRSGQSCSEQGFTQLLDAELLELKGADFERYGLNVVATFSDTDIPPAERADARKAWEARKQEIANFHRSAPGRFRVRLWEVDEERAGLEGLPAGEPLIDVQLSLFENQQADWHDVSMICYINEYQGSMEVWLPEASSAYIGVGNHCLVDWSSGVISARLQHCTLDKPIDQYDTLERDPLPVIIERPTTTLRQLNWSTHLTAGQHSMAATPGDSGRVLIADLERME